MFEKLKKMFKYNDNDAALFEDVVFIVQATHNEMMSFWRDYYYEPQKGYPKVSWKEISVGHGVQVGQVDKRPVVISINYAIINGQRVMFYCDTSQIVDHEMISEWLKLYSLDTILWDNGTRWAHCNSSNFHLCLNAIEEKNKAT